MILLKSAPSRPPNMKYLAIFGPSKFHDPQAGPRGQIMEGKCRLVKKHPRVSGCSDPDVVKQKYSF